MNGLTLVFTLAGLIGFVIGAYLSATGDRAFGIVAMAIGLAFQVLALVRLRSSRKEGGTNAR